LAGLCGVTCSLRCIDFELETVSRRRAYEERQDHRGANYRILNEQEAGPKTDGSPGGRATAAQIASAEAARYGTGLPLKFALTMQTLS
jgi:hypothetical protein